MVISIVFEFLGTEIETLALFINKIAKITKHTNRIPSKCAREFGTHKFMSFAFQGQLDFTICSETAARLFYVAQLLKLEEQIRLG